MMCIQYSYTNCWRSGVFTKYQWGVKTSNKLKWIKKRAKLLRWRRKFVVSANIPTLSSSTDQRLQSLSIFFSALKNLHLKKCSVTLPPSPCIFGRCLRKPFVFSYSLANEVKSILEICLWKKRPVIW